MSGTLALPTSGSSVSGTTIAQDVNVALAALGCGLAQSSAPTAAALGFTSLAGVSYYNTANNIGYRRDLADTVWMPFFQVDETAKSIVMLSGGVPLFGGSVQAAGTADALTATFHPAPAALVDGGLYPVRAAAANATTTPTININALGAVTITDLGGGALVAGSISGAGHELMLRYNATANHMELLDPATASVGFTLDTDGTLAANSDTKVPSQKAVKTYAMPLSYLDTDGTLSANSNAKVASQAAVRTYVAAQLAGLTATDLTARDQIALTNLRLMLNTSVSTGALIAGKQWELLTDELATGSSSYIYSSGSPNYYSNLGASGLYTPTGATFHFGAVNYGTDAVPFDGVITSRGYTSCFYCTSAGDFAVGKAFSSPQPVASVKIYSSATSFYNGAGNNTLTVNVYGKNSAPSSATDGTLLGSLTFSDPASTFNIQTIPCNGSSFQYVWVDIIALGGNTGFSQVQYYTYAGSTNMTLVSPTVSVSTAPTYVDCYFLWKDDSGSAVLGTDLTVELSRDGGTTWTTATITNPLGAGGFDGTFAVLRGRANVGSQPSGTSLKARIKTLNNKVQRVAAPAVYAE